MTRSLHLIDIENLSAGGAHAAQERLAMHLEATWSPGDLVAIASNAKIWRQLAWDVPVAHRFMVTTNRPDSADQALLSTADDYDLSSFGQLVIGFGDHIFADLALDAADCGVRVVVVANEGSVARTLRTAAHEIHQLAPVRLNELAA